MLSTLSTEPHSSKTVVPTLEIAFNLDSCRNCVILLFATIHRVRQKVDIVFVGLKPAGLHREKWPARTLRLNLTLL